VRIYVLTLAGLLAAGALAAAETAAVRQAREQLEHVRKLADAGAASRKQLEQATEAFQQAQDDVVISETLETRVSVEELTEEQSAEATAAAARRVERQQGQLAQQAELVRQGVAPRASLLPFEEEVESARRILSAMEQRARSLEEIAAMIRAEQEVTDQQPDQQSIADGANARITRFAGEKKFGSEELKQVVLEFERKFDRKLPMSARGDTALHRSMGFDHRGRVDVALNPDGVEGRWLMRFLEQRKLPFFAFRTAVRGQATAPHIHMGPPSTRFRATD
jgi:hypothetical protein